MIDPRTRRLIEFALSEDVGHGDATSCAAVPRDINVAARVVAREDMVVSGLPVAAAVFEAVDPSVAFRPRTLDGARVPVGFVVAEVAGTAQSLLTAERTALNFLQRLCGVATLTARYVAAVEETGARIVDTRKTIPGFRALDKAAVRHGGGTNHRFGLDDGILIKDNHIAAAGSLTAAVQRAREHGGYLLQIEVECDTLEQVHEALAARAEVVLLDNMPPETLRRAVELCRGRARTEASGGISLETVRAVAASGVDFISVGALTHSAPAADLALDFETSG